MDIYEQQSVTPTFWMLGERLCSWQILTMGLVLGRERAALIDTGMGVLGDLKAKVGTLTGLPLVTLLTHGDPDHIGGAELFDPVYMNPLDAELVPWALDPKSKWENLELMVEGNAALLAEAKEKMLRATALAFQPLSEGDVFDLGGVQLEAVALPGHSKGSLCFVNWRDGYAFVGDAVCRNTFLWLKRSPPLSVHLAALERFRSRVGDGMTLYFGHSLAPLPKTMLVDSIRCCREVLAGETARDPFYNPEVGKDQKPDRLMQHTVGTASIVYDADRVC